MKNRLRLFVLLLCAVGVLSARIQFYRAHIHPNLQNAKVTIRKAVLLPPLITFTKLGMKGAEGMSAESERLAGDLYSLLAKELTARGVEVVPDPMAAAVTPEAKYAIANLQSRYDTLRLQLKKKPQRVDKGQASLGDGVAAFAPAAGADVLVFVRGTAVKATAARKAAILIGHGAWSRFEGEVGFIDAKSGEVLAWTRINRTRDLSEDAGSKLEKNVSDDLSDIPLPIPGAKR